MVIWCGILKNNFFSKFEHFQSLKASIKKFITKLVCKSVVTLIKIRKCKETVVRGVLKNRFAKMFGKFHGKYLELCDILLKTAGY